MLDPIIHGPFQQTTFMGASLIGFTSVLGWNDQPSQVDINLVEDPKLNQQFNPAPGIGHPFTFQFGKFKFRGLLSSHQQKNGTDGKPIWSVRLSGPNEILDCATVIMNQYDGKVGVSNVINVYGYWERFGFGTSFVNDSGMWWETAIQGGGTFGIRPALEACTQGNGQGYGGPIKYRDNNYSIDCSGLPKPPPYYRLGGGVNMSVHEIISKLCQDSGFDYIVTLNDNNSISFKSVSRREQPALGQVSAYISGKPNISNEQHGREMRNGITSAYLIGGNRQDLVIVQNDPTAAIQKIIPYWGIDTNTGQVIVGQGNGDGMQVQLDASPIQSVFGKPYYTASLLELRFAATNYDSWAWFVNITNAPVINQIPIPTVLNTDFTGFETFQDFHSDKPSDLIAFSQLGGMNKIVAQAQILYGFLKGIADIYLGKKYLVATPLINGRPLEFKRDPDTKVVTFSDIPSDEGAYLGENATPLGIQTLNQDFFTDDAEKWHSFVAWLTHLDKIDLSLIDGNSLIQQNGMYRRCTIPSQIYFVNGTPAVLVELGTPCQNRIQHPQIGDVDTIARIANISTDKIIDALTTRTTAVPLKCLPSFVTPDGVGIAMKSNRECYGPWGVIGNAGKVYLHQDTSLVPWNYGGYTVLNIAANAMIQNVPTNQQEGEVGQVEMAQAPEHSLGDELVSEGANLTGIDVSIGAQGIKTSYKLSTYIRNLGNLGNQIADRLRRQGVAAADMRKKFREALRRRSLQNTTFGQALYTGLSIQSWAIAQRSPHSMLLGTLKQNKHGDWLPNVSSLTSSEMIGNLESSGDRYIMSAGMSWDGLLMPCSVTGNVTTSGGDSLPSFFANSGVKRYTGDIWDINPFQKDCHVQSFVSGSGDCQGLNPRITKSIDPGQARVLGLRTPLVLVGWGFELTGKPVPNDGQATSSDDQDEDVNDWSDSFPEDYLKQPDGFTAGPFDTRWDKWRKCWTPYYDLLGNLVEDLPGGDIDMNPHSGVSMTLIGPEDTVGTDEKIVVHNVWKSQITRGTLVKASYHPLFDAWYVSAADC